MDGEAPGPPPTPAWVKWLAGGSLVAVAVLAVVHFTGRMALHH